MKSNQKLLKKDQSTKATKQPGDSIPPRQFPKKQYQKLTHHLWTTIIGTIILIVIICTLGGVIGSHVTSHHSDHHQAKPTKTTKPVKKRCPAHHVNSHPAKPAKKLSPKQGEHLLGHWLTKLHYPTGKSQAVLNDYQKSNQNREVQISQKLNQLSQSSASNNTKQKQIQQFINHQFK